MPEPSPPPPRTRGRARALLTVLLIGVTLATAGFFYWRYTQTYESTDDAQVDGHLNSISPRIAGTITAVYFDENQFATAEAAVAGAERDYLAALGRLREAEANDLKAHDDLGRYKALVEKDEIARQIYDQAGASASAATAAVDTARAAAEASQKIVDQRRAQLAQSQSRLAEADANAPHQLAISHASVAAKQADAQVTKARLEQARLNVSYTKIYAPVSGVISKRSVEVGNHVQAGQQLFLIAQIDNPWVTANFKETQLAHIRPGQRVSIEVDAYGNRLNGYVESMPGATGAIMSLLPPENATGNYVKVVQRLPVRIRFDKNQQGLDRLRPGMSVVPKVMLK